MYTPCTQEDVHTPCSKTKKTHLLETNNVGVHEGLEVEQLCLKLLYSLCVHDDMVSMAMCA